MAGEAGRRLIPPPPLLAITAGDGRDLDPWVHALGAAGLPGLLIREPSLSRRALDRALRAARGIPFVAVHVRTAAPASGDWVVHGPAGFDPSSVARPCGVSCHDEQEVDTALGRGAAYVLLSPVWAPTSKPDDRREPLGEDRLLEAAAGRPVLALGGVDPERYRRLRDAGVGAAVLGDLFGRSSPDAAARRLAAYLD